ncbi:MAG: low affinity iron permease family protein [Chitinophagales bacterium]
MSNTRSHSNRIEEIASKIMKVAGSSTTLICVFLLVILWAVSGIFFRFSEKWEMVMGTSSSFVTILMVFLIQKSQNKHSLSIQLKLNELVAANEKASNRLVNVEGMTEAELKVIEKYYSKLSDFAQNQGNLQQSHSIDGIHEEHTIKKEMEQELDDVKKVLKD